jgi:hypothetical protein
MWHVTAELFFCNACVYLAELLWQLSIVDAKLAKQELVLEGRVSALAAAAHAQ